MTRSLAAHTRKALVGLLVALVATLMGASADAASSGAAHSIDLVNESRSDAGRSNLTRDAGLDSVAKAQAQRMADRDAIYHNPNLGSDADAAGVNWTWIAENVGVGPDVDAVHNGFMNSQGHRDNVLFAEFNAIGAAVVVGSDGSSFVAHVFAHVAASEPAKAEAPKNEASKEDAPAAIEPKPEAKPKVDEPKAEQADEAKADTAHDTKAPQTSTETKVAPVTQEQTAVVTVDSPLPNAIFGGIVDLKIVI